MKTDILILIGLLEDPDEEIYRTVAQKILSFGKIAMPVLEQHSFNASSTIQYDRINEILQELRFRYVKDRFSRWLSNEQDSITGLSLITELISPDFDTNEAFKFYNTIRNEIWLEFNSRLTALEKIRVINKILFEKKKILVDINAKKHPSNFTLKKISIEKKAAPESIFALYLILVRLLELPVFSVNLTKANILVYIDYPLKLKKGFDPGDQPNLFYILPAMDGRIIGYNEVSQYITFHYEKFSRNQVQGITDLEMVRNFTKQLSKSCKASGKTDLEHMVNELLTLW